MNYITWLYFLVENQGKDNEKVIFLYGLSLTTKTEKSDTIIKSEKIDNNRQIVVFSTVCENILSTIDNKIDFTNFIKSEKSPLDIINYKELIQVANEVNRDIPNSLITSPLYVKCFYTSEFYHYYEDKNFENKLIESLIKILTVLENMSGQKFTLNYAKRLGCYEIGQSQDWVEDKLTPFLVDTQKTEETIKYVLKIDKNYNFERISIHLIIYNNDNEIVQDIIKSTQNDYEIILTEIKKEDNGSLEYWIFNEDGILIDRNKFVFIRSISLNTSLIGKSYDISASNYSNKSPLKNKDRKLATYSQGFQSNIEIDKISDIEEKANSIYTELKSYNEKEKLYKNGIWFDIGEQDNLIKFLNKITQNGAYKITFIDPFISSNASIDYLYHFENQQISMKFISCWETSISPDDSEVEKDIDVSINELQQNLKNIKDYNIPLKTAQWYNLESKKFHDRFLYIENVSSGEKQVYSLSNSLNNMLKKYSLLITPLNGEVLKKALNYLESIFLECSDENKIFPKVDH